MKFTTTDLTKSQTEILKFPDHYVAMPVTVDDDGISAGSNGKKIVPAGTIVGNATAGGTLADDTKKVKVHAPAALSTDLAGDDNDLVYTAKVNRTIKIAYIDPSANDQALSVSVTVDTINVSLKTGSGGEIESTAAEVKAAIEAHYQANELVSIADKGEDDGSGAVIAMAAATLTGGIPAEGILLNDVDVTSGDMSGAMLVHGFVATAKLPTAPSTQARKDLEGRIVFIK